MYTGSIPNRRSRSGFTLVELLVVVSLIVLIASIALPTILSAFQSGAEEQAFNMISGQLHAARSLAIAENTFAGVHIQRADATTEMADRYEFYSAVVILEKMGNRDIDGTKSAIVDLAPGFEPRKLPGSIGVIDADELLADGRTYSEQEDAEYGWYGDLRIREGHSIYGMTIMFGPQGQLVRRVRGQKIRFDPGSPLVSGDNAIWTDDRGAHYGGNQDEDGRTTLVLIDLATVKGFGNDPKSDILNEKGSFISINAHTGLLDPRK